MANISGMAAQIRAATESENTFDLAGRDVSAHLFSFRVVFVRMPIPEFILGHHKYTMMECR